MECLATVQNEIRFLLEVLALSLLDSPIPFSAIFWVQFRVQRDLIVEKPPELELPLACAHLLKTLAFDISCFNHFKYFSAVTSFWFACASTLAARCLSRWVASFCSDCLSCLRGMSAASYLLLHSSAVWGNWNSSLLV